MKHYIPKKELRYYLRTTKSDIAFQKRILKYILWGIPLFAFWSIMGINFLFWIFTGKVG